jgi:hypothetical protein
MATAAPAKAPVHLWIVGVLSLLWNAFGAIDYTMSQLRNEAWLSQLTEAQRAWLDSSPAWADAAWALGVWGALLGSLLLLIRSGHAYWAFEVSLAGLFVSTIFQYYYAPMPGGENSRFMTIMMIAIWVIAIGLLVYAYRMRAKGVLR